MPHDVHQAVHAEGLSPDKARHLQGPNQVTVLAGDKLSSTGQQVRAAVPERQVPLLLGAQVPQEQRGFLLCVQWEELGLGKTLLDGFGEFLPGIYPLLRGQVSASRDSQSCRAENRAQGQILNFLMSFLPNTGKYSDVRSPNGQICTTKYKGSFTGFSGAQQDKEQWPYTEMKSTST